MTTGYSEENAERLLSKNHYWFMRFRSTMSFNKLTKSEQANAFYITQAFVGLSYRHQLRNNRRWTATSVIEIITQYFPRNIAADDVYFNAILPVLRRYFRFLGVQHKISNSQTLINAVDTIDVQQVTLASHDSTKWSEKKRTGMHYLFGVDNGCGSLEMNNWADVFNMQVPLNLNVGSMQNGYKDNDKIIALTPRRRQDAAEKLRRRQ